MQAQIDAFKDELKDEMKTHDVSKLSIGDYNINFTNSSIICMMKAVLMDY